MKPPVRGKTAMKSPALAAHGVRRADRKDVLLREVNAK
jgi:hypothetical protein